MKDTSLFSWDSGSFIIIFVFSAVVIGIVATVLIMMYTDTKKK